MISPRTQHIFRIISQKEIKKDRIYFGTKCNRLTVSDRFDSLASSVANWDNSRKSIEISFSPLCGGIGKRGVELSRSTAEVVEAEGLAINFLELRRLRPLLSEKKRQEDLFPRNARSDKASCVFARTQSNYCSRCERRILRVKAVRRNCTCLAVPGEGSARDRF